jgi:hypothetical protein
MRLHSHPWSIDAVAVLASVNGLRLCPSSRVGPASPLNRSQTDPVASISVPILRGLAIRLSRRSRDLAARQPPASATGPRKA